MTVPLLVLAVLSVIGGFFNVPEALGGSAHLAEFLNPIFELSHKVRPEAFHETLLTHSEEYMLMGISSGVAILSLVVAYVLYIQRVTMPEPDTVDRPVVEKVLYNKYYIDELYETIIVKPTRGLSDAFYSFGEFLIDGVVNGIGWGVKQTSGQLRKMQTGSIGFYLFAMGRQHCHYSVAAVFYQVLVHGRIGQQSLIIQLVDAYTFYSALSDSGGPAGAGYWGGNRPNKSLFWAHWSNWVYRVTLFSALFLMLRRNSPSIIRGLPRAAFASVPGSTASVCCWWC
jgi:hypothetical protein